MHITKELIEKYHSGICTQEEKEAIEGWLFSDEMEDDLLLKHGEDKLKYKDEMWEEIASILPNHKKSPEIATGKSFFSLLWKQAAAAVVLFGTLGVTIYYLTNPAIKPGTIVVNNLSDTINKNYSESKYSISIGPKSNIEINNQTGIIDLCGAMMINHKKDIELTIKGICSKNNIVTEKMMFKKGQNYIALNYSSYPETNEVIILQEGSMMGLPPVIMRQIINQFNI